jgi:hypothetical protein
MRVTTTVETLIIMRRNDMIISNVINGKKQRIIAWNVIDGRNTEM